MLRSLRKAANSLERSLETAFSAPSPSHTAFTNTVITISSFTVRLGRVIAEGGFSFIHIATPITYANSNRRYAVKRLNCQSSEARAQAENEIEHLHAIPRHPNIVPFHGATFLDGHAFLLFDLIDGGTLPERIAQRTRHGSPPFSPDEAAHIFEDIVSAVAHVHALDPPRALRDVKLENVLYDRMTCAYRLCDFGSVTTRTFRASTRSDALMLEEEASTHCTAMYRAPELADPYHRVSGAPPFVCEKVDVWSLGCIWHCLLFSTLPFDGSSALAICNGLPSSDSQLPRSAPCAPAIPAPHIAILRAALDVDPAERADAFSLLFALRALRRTAARGDEGRLRAAARRLRCRRDADFGGAPIAVDIDLGPGVTDASPRGAAAASAGPGDVVVADDDWADFESAFGEAAPSCTTPPPAPSQAPRSVVGHTGPLIDFSGVPVEASSTASSLRSSGGAAHVAQNGGKEQSHEQGGGKDLIDFFSNVGGA